MIGSFTKKILHTQLHLYATGLVFGTGTLPSVLSSEGICGLRGGRKALGKEVPTSHNIKGIQNQVQPVAVGKRR